MLQICVEIEFKAEIIWESKYNSVYSLYYIYPSSKYVQLLYRPHFGILPFGLLDSKMKISERMEFLLKYATFWSGFFMFLWSKI